LKRNGVVLAESAYDTAARADAVVLVTEWGEFRELDLVRLKKAMAGDVFLDGRNFLEPESLTSLGFRYSGMGRGNKNQEVPTIKS
jgi:UDPglucose 6-dehydrogenase